jgi:hypothetical protein
MISPKKPENFNSNIIFYKNPIEKTPLTIKLLNETRIIVRNLFNALIDCEISTEVKKKKLIS